MTEDKYESTFGVLLYKVETTEGIVFEYYIEDASDVIESGTASTLDEAIAHARDALDKQGLHKASTSHDLIWALSTASRLATESEQARIIALLETLSFDVINTTELVEHHYRDGSTRMQPRRIDKDDLIALVKSETK